MAEHVHVHAEPFDQGAALNAFSEAAAGAGAIVSFTGVTRDVADGDMVAMEIEHYPGMTERALSDIRAEAMERFKLTDAMVIHRHGRLAPGEVIMMVATASKHRADAFQGAEFLMDYLKSRAPFWKREITARGADWVAAKDEDEAALDRW
ncbi:molybdenum cofactor biosynthesis protein MoaE [Rhodobacteraceae bacterium N5(2021)]|uniref:Molybdopterin synthase catalytic subunit n=1 Tax=Gymnodinialimonas phycosphaerae TaxID=2841589 RepID=A0A975YEL0_9RHOB|nr:molybdenum cofactor biosynthesis protein MoaE [Gymnodinialimonas phycosphaerae]MBY4893784.1 molybdenum cofactor biosynthesis protein MoaE [Gymnodinialimonas phycosphaerae]